MASEPELRNTASDSISVELANLRGDVREGFAEIRGQLNLISQAHNATATDVVDLDKRVAALEARSWPLVPMAAVSGIISAIAAAVTFLVQQ